MKKLLASVLLFAILLCMFSCQVPEDEVLTDTDATIKLEDDEFLLLDEYALVCPAFLRSNDNIIKSLNYLKNALIACGSKGVICDDSSQHDRKGEIIVGATSRPQSENMLAGMGIDGFEYMVMSQNEIVICGGSNASTFEAVKKFCNDILGYDESKPDASLRPILKAIGFSKQAAYRDEHEIYIGGVALKDFKIAVSRPRDTIYADAIIEALGVYTGYAFPTVLFEELTPDDKGVICVGYYDRAKTEALANGTDGYNIRFSEQDGKVTVGIGATARQQCELAIAALSEVLGKLQNGQSLELPAEPITNITYFTDPTYTPEWFLKSEKSEIVADGVEYKEFLYSDASGKPYRAYALMIDPQKNSLLMGSANDGYEYTTDSPQTVADQMIAAQNNGYNVIAGVNADFFAMGGDNHPSGLTVKQGVLISRGTKGRAYFAITKDGMVEIGANGASADVTNLQTAVGGSDILVENYLPRTFDMVNSSFNYTGHPRTLAGVREDGTIILAVIDGRQGNISNGASLERCALFMLSLGAKNAVNLDGGGSTCLITNRGGELITHNSPSDGSLRKVYNSLIVYKKEN